MRTAAIFALLLAVQTAPAAAAPDAATRILFSLNALERQGRMRTCDLAGIPVESGGYWPCVDAGPYRFVIEYVRVRGYVVVRKEGKESLFPVFEADAATRRGGFLYEGPWSEDMAPTLAGAGRLGGARPSDGVSGLAEAEKTVKEWQGTAR